MTGFIFTTHHCQEQPAIHSLEGTLEEQRGGRPKERDSRCPGGYQQGQCLDVRDEILCEDGETPGSVRGVSFDLIRTTTPHACWFCTSSIQIQNPKIVFRVVRSEVAAPIPAARAVLFS
jgi:hypothetical protein